MSHYIKHTKEYWIERKEARRLRKIRYLRAWRAANPDTWKAANARWRAQHPRWRQVLTDAQKAKKHAQTKAWMAAHPESRKRYAATQRLKGAFRTAAFRSRSALRRSRTKSHIHPDHDHSIELALFAECQRLGVETGVMHELDHIIPLWHGGCHHHQNLQPLPRTINKRKGANPTWTMPGYKSWRDVPEYLWPEQLKNQYNALK